MILKHYYSFGNDLVQNMNLNKLDLYGWETLRNNHKSPKDFSIEKTRKDWLRNCARKSGYRKSAQIVCRIINKHKWKKAVSLGVGKGILEYHIKKIIPELDLKCTDFTPDSLKLLSQVFTENDRFSTFNMLEDNYDNLAKEDVIIINRLSTEFSRKQWNEIFKKLYCSNIKNIIYIPTEVLNLNIILDEKRKYIINLLQGKKNIFCGWMYSKKEFEKFFSGTSKRPLYKIIHSYKLANSAIFELKRNQ